MRGRLIWKKRRQALDPLTPQYRRSGDDSLWAVIATIGRVVRIAEVFSGYPLALKDQTWREAQVRAYMGFLERSGLPAPRYTIKPIRRTDLPKRWRPLPALGFLHGNC